jgi:D-tyrosyl-tRNA(Tyr) deacylase
VIPASEPPINQSWLLHGIRFRELQLLATEEGQVKLVIQRVSRAEVRVEGKIVGSIDIGFMVLVGLERDDTEAQVEQAARRVATLRVFEDDQGKMNRGLDEVGGAVLAVSQFTLAASVRRGRRPGFDRALPGDQAEPLFTQFVDHLRSHGIHVETGTFGAFMEVELVNSGPVTLLWDG